MAIEKYDIAIVGAGCVGNLMANILVQQSPTLRIALIDKHMPPSWQQTNFSPRVYAINHTTQALLVRLGVWQNMSAQRYQAYQTMQVWQDDLSHGLRFSASEAGYANLGYILEHDYLNAHLYQPLERGVTHIPAQVDAMVSVEKGMQLSLGEQRVQAKLIIAADGAHSTIRTHAGFNVQHSDYLQTALVANVQLDRADQVTQTTAFQRFLPTGPLAFLPLASGEHTIVWSLPTTLAKRYRALGAAAFINTLLANSKALASQITLTSERLAFPLQHHQVTQYVKPRVALIGDAAHAVHPLAGQGLNLGARDCLQLANVLSYAQNKQADIGALLYLNKYQRAVKGFNTTMANSFALLNNAFANDNVLVAKLRQTGLQFVNNNQALKALFIKQAVANI